MRKNFTKPGNTLLKWMFVSIGLLFTSLGCESKLPKVKPEMVEPYAVEFIAFKRGDIHIYFNRKVTEEDVGLYIFPLLYTDTCCPRPYNLQGLSIPMEKTSGNKLSIPFPFTYTYLMRLKRHNSQSEINRFVQQLKGYFKGTKCCSKPEIKFRPELPNSIAVSIFHDGHRSFDTMDFITFSVKDEHKYYKRIDKNLIWRFNKDICRNFKGIRNAKGEKQGKWTWFYYNGSKMAETTFENDQLSDSLIFYSFDGSVQNCVPPGKKYYSRVR